MNNRFLSKLLSTFIIFSTLIVLVQCRSKSSGTAPMVTIDSLQTDFEFTIHNWQLIGPFIAESQRVEKKSNLAESAMGYDYLKDFGTSEGSFTSADFLKVDRANTKFPQLLDSKFTNRAITDSASILNFLKYFIKSDNSTAYAYCDIYCSKEQEVMLTTSSDDGMMAWINGELIINKPDFRAYNINGDVDYWKGRLKKGKNALLIKVNNGVYNWGLQCTVFGGARMRKLVETPNLVKFLNTVVYHPSDTLKYNNDLFQNNDSAQLTVINCFGQIESSQRFSNSSRFTKDLASLKDGIYLSEVKIGSFVFKQWFYCGIDLEDYYLLLKKRCEKYRDEHQQITLRGLLFRINHLLKPENAKINQLEWQEKTIDIIRDVELILHDLENNDEPFKNKTGMHIRGFRSVIDNQDQYYLVYIPSNYNPASPCPLVTVVPSVTDPRRHFLKSYLLANLKEQQGNILESEKGGFILVWPGARCYSDGMAIGGTELEEVVAQVKKDYNIDEKRLSLLGSCSGGLEAFLFGARFPSVIASIAVFSPYTSRGGAMKSSFVLNPAMCEDWLKRNSPIEFVSNLRNTPLYTLHAIDNHAPVEQSENLIRVCKDKGVELHAEIIPSDLGSNQFGISNTKFSVYDFFKGKVAMAAPKKIEFSTWQLKFNRSFWVVINSRLNTITQCKIIAEVVKQNTIHVTTENVGQYAIILTDLNFNRMNPIEVNTNGRISVFNNVNQDTLVVDVEVGHPNTILHKTHDIEGPISHAFASGFMLVDCQDGEGKAHTMSGPCRSLFSAWKRDFFVDSLRYKKADEVTAKDINSFNLVLFGNEANNGVIKRISQNLPIQLLKDKIIFCGKSFRGRRVGAIFIYPNPLNPLKYIVLVTSNNWPAFQLPEMNLSLEAFYDFIVFDATSINSNYVSDILGVGDFNGTWDGIELSH